jgi:hypothetical protein
MPAPLLAAVPSLGGGASAAALDSTSVIQDVIHEEPQSDNDGDNGETSPPHGSGTPDVVGRFDIYTAYLRNLRNEQVCHRFLSPLASDVAEMNTFRRKRTLCVFLGIHAGRCDLGPHRVDREINRCVAFFGYQNGNAMVANTRPSLCYALPNQPEPCSSSSRRSRTAPRHSGVALQMRSVSTPAASYSSPS